MNSGDGVPAAQHQVDVVFVNAPPDAKAAPPPPSGLLVWASEFWGKCKGTDEKPVAPEAWQSLLISWAGAFIAMLVVCVLNQYVSPDIDFEFLIASFGASAVLMFGLPAAKLSQPRNVIGGQTFSALTGAIVRVIIRPRYRGADFVSGALGMSLSLTVMQATGTTHPPAGATGLLAALATPMPDWQGFKFVLTALAGSSIMVVVAVLFNNLIPNRRYPTFW